MTNQYALGYKAGLEAAVKVCRDEENSWVADSIGAKAVEVVRLRIEHLPVQEVQWRDLTEVAELLDTVWLMHEHLKLQPYYTEHHNIYDKASAVIAKFKEKNK